MAAQKPKKAEEKKQEKEEVKVNAIGEKVIDPAQFDKKVK